VMNSRRLTRLLVGQAVAHQPRQALSAPPALPHCTSRLRQTGHGAPEMKAGLPRPQVRRKGYR
jgi:hypothetical protein